MSWLDNIEDLSRDYGCKNRHLKFMRRMLTPEIIEVLTKGFGELWDFENSRIFPRVMEIPLNARRILHPKEKDPQSWLDVMKVNDRLLSFPTARIEQEISEALGNLSAAKRLKGLWDVIRACSMRENEFIDRHLPTITRLVSQCPGSWLERPTYIAFHRLCSGLPVLLETLERDLDAWKLFYEDFHALRKRPLDARIIGIGEITTTIELVGDPGRSIIHRESGKRVHYVVKKMPNFPDLDSARGYAALYDEYHRILRDRVGLRVPLWGTWVKDAPKGKAVVYDWQERLPQESIASLIIHHVGNDAVARLFRLILDRLAQVFRFNRSGADIIIGFDGQLPNWSVVGYNPIRPEIWGNEPLIYFDTSTPLIRRRVGAPLAAPTNDNGEKISYGPDLLDVSVLLKAVPAPVRPILRLLAVHEVIDRYYDARKVITDLIASFYLYKRPDMVPEMVEEANKFLKAEMPEFEIAPFTVEEMAKYHKTDTMIWVAFRAMKRLDRWITEQLLGRRYGQRLPKVKFTPGPFGDH